MPDIFYVIFGFVLAIGILVVIHEWGHYIAAKLTGMRADVFSFGMGRRLFGWNKKTGFTFGPLPRDYEYDGTTDWRFSLLPIGGYVKIPGMVDESFDNEFADSEPKPWEFRSKNTLQKAFVLSNGVIMNILLSIIVFGGIFFFNGESSIATTRFAYVSNIGIANDLGFQSGDSLLAINGEKVDSWDELIFELALNNVGENTKVDLIRNEEPLSLTINNEPILSELSNHDNKDRSPTNVLGFDLPYQKIFTTAVMSLSPADKLGLQKGDTILAINNKKIYSSLQMFDGIKNNSDNIPLSIRWKRGDKIYNGIAYTKDNKLGFGYAYKYVGPIKKKEFTLLESANLGYEKTLSFFGVIFKSIGKMIKGVVKFEDAMAGPVTIANQAGKTLSYSFLMFIDLVAKLSISLALINILPIPALDGGHLLIVLIEGLRRKELNTKTKIVIQNFGVLFLFIFMLIILYIDILRI